MNKNISKNEADDCQSNLPSKHCLNCGTFVVAGTFGELALVNTSLLVDNLEYAPERRECRYAKYCRRNKILNP